MLFHTCCGLFLSIFVSVVLTAQGPSFLHEPPSLVLFSNNTGTVLSCSGDGTAPLIVRWMDANDRNISHIHGLRHILSNGSLFLPPFPGSSLRHDFHLTTYRCAISNNVGTIVSRACRVKAVIAEDYQVEVADAHTLLGNVAVLKCEASANVRDLLTVVSWLKENSLLHRAILHEGTGRYASTGHGELHLSDATIEDSMGRFYCQTVHSLTGERKISTPGKIVISGAEGNVPPSIGDTLRVVTGKTGTKVNLACPAQGFPSPTVRWFSNFGGRLEELPHAPPRSILTFPMLQLHDSGRYVCVARNILGEDRREMLLRVASELTVNIRPAQQVVDAGYVASFNCSAVGGQDTHRSISWRKDGILLSQDGRVTMGANGLSLSVRNVRRSDAGMYQCFVSCGDESSQASAHLSMGAVAPELLSTFFDRTMEPGPPVTMSCSSSGNPPPQITWLKDGGDIRPQDYAHGTFLDSSGHVISHLNISSVRVHHGAVYTCIARNLLGTAQHSAALNIYGPPSPRPQLNLTVVASTDVLLRCPVAGYPLKVSWSRGSSGLPSGSRHIVLRNGTLLIRHVEGPNDAGLYACNAESNIGISAQGRINLEVMKPPQIAPLIFPSGLQEGMRAQVACSLIAGDLPITIIWRKDGGPLPPDPAVQEQQFGFVSNLLFTDLAARHSGHYTCIASNAAAVANATAELVIRVAPVWEIEPRDASVLIQDAAAVHCVARGFPPPKITWVKPSGEQVDSSESGLILCDNGTLFVLESTRNREGHYICKASNGVGSGLSKTIFLRVNVPARFKNKAQTQSGVAGESIVLTCEAEGDPPLQVTWLAKHRPSIPLYPQVREKHSSQSLVSELHINNISRRDEGTFRCKCTNEFGYDEALIRLVVREAPGVPRAPALTEVRSRWLGVAWEASAGMRVLVQYRPANVSSDWSNISVPNDVQHTRISLLFPGTPYLVRLIALNEVGASSPSPAIRATTLQEAPERVPTDVSADGTGPSTAVVRWQPIEADSYTKVTGYIITWFEEGSPVANPQRRTVRGAERYMVILSRLNTFTRYKVAVCAFNLIGVGPLSPSVPFTTFQGVPNHPPENVRCAPLSSQSLRVMWQPPPESNRLGEIEGYRIVYSTVAEPPTSKSTTNLETTLHGLRKAANYTVSLVSFTVAGDGARSNPIFCHTNEDLPGAPSRIKALPMTSDSIILAWTPPGEQNGIITKYTVYMSPVRSMPSPQVLQSEVSPDGELVYEARRLKEMVRYEFWVTASTSAGEGRASLKITQTPLSKVPARIGGWSQTISGFVGDRVVFACRLIGLPAPTPVWRGPGGQLLPPPQSKHQKLLPNGSLLIMPLRARDTGNYTCFVDNVYGRDEITYFLSVIVVPNPPSATITATDAHSALVEWRNNGDGGSPITAYVISWRPTNGVSLELTVYDSSAYRLVHLQCGHNYQITVSAINRVGRSKPSSVLVATTSGSVPGIPNPEEFLLVNKTSVILLVDEWPDGGCRMKRFAVELKSHDLSDLSMNHYDANVGEITLADLLAGRWYTLHVTAINEAGSTKHVFPFATLTVDGNFPPTKITQDVEEVNDAVNDVILILVAIVSGILCTVAVVICICICAKRRSSRGEKTDASNDCSESSCGKMSSHLGLLPQLPAVDCKAHGRKGSSASNHDYEICPYATFNLPEAEQSAIPRRDYSLHIRSFNHQECFEGVPEEEIQLKRMRSSKSPPDGLSLEVSCISSQQTLPMRATPHHRARKAESGKKPRPESCPTRKYDSDSSDRSTTPAQSPVDKHQGWKTPRHHRRT